MTLLQGCTLPAVQMQLCQTSLSLHSAEGASPSAASQQDSQSSPCTWRSLPQQPAVKSQVPEADKAALLLFSYLTYWLQPKKKKEKKNNTKVKFSQSREREQGPRGHSTTFLCTPQSSINKPCSSISTWRHGSDTQRQGLSSLLCCRHHAWPLLVSKHIHKHYSMQTDSSLCTASSSVFAQTGFNPWRDASSCCCCPELWGTSMNSWPGSAHGLSELFSNEDFSFWGFLSWNTEFPALEGGEESVRRNGESCLSFFIWIVLCELVLTPSRSNTDLTDMRLIMKEVLIETKWLCRTFITSDLYLPFIDLGREVQLSSIAVNPVEAEVLM